MFIVGRRAFVSLRQITQSRGAPASVTSLRNTAISRPTDTSLAGCKQLTSSACLWILCLALSEARNGSPLCNLTVDLVILAVVKSSPKCTYGRTPLSAVRLPVLSCRRHKPPGRRKLCGCCSCNCHHLHRQHYVRCNAPPSCLHLSFVGVPPSANE